MMCTLRWTVLLIIVLAGIASAQTIQANRLCLHNGGEYYLQGPYDPSDQWAGGKYFPSFTHWAARPGDRSSQVYPWKVAGWCWHADKPMGWKEVWYFETCLQKSVDNPYSTTMSWDYPALYCTGAVPHSGYPMPLYCGTFPSVIPFMGGNQIVMPSSMGGWDAYLNIFAFACASWGIPTNVPNMYGWDFGLVWNCASAITVPSSCSIYEYVWVNRGPETQYLLVSGNETDCLGGGGNKGRSYSLFFDGSYCHYWPNNCSGTTYELAMCLFLCDAVTVPYNVPSATKWSNPFASYGFDVGVAALTPYLSSNSVHLGFMTEDHTHLGGMRVVLASFASHPCFGSYGKQLFRVPHGWDQLTAFFMQVLPLYLHMPSAGYPASMFGSTVGAHTIAIPFPADPALVGSEIRYSSFPFNPGQAMSASFMVTYF